MGRRLLGYLLIGAAIVLIAAVAYLHTVQSRSALVFSPSQILAATWIKYKMAYLETGTGRTVDPARNAITTSEGEGYSMLRAVWLGDKQSFDTSWTWTKNNLQHKSGDHLFAWMFGKNPNGTYGVMVSDGGDTSAADADTDIALALLFAYGRWQDHQYIGDARVIMADIWSKEVVMVGGTPYLVADNKEKGSARGVLINPSYLNPAAYHIFGQFDNSHPWDALAASSYVIIDKSIASPLNANASAGLPPDWVLMNTATGAIAASGDATTTTTNFGFDAMRLPWRMTLASEWFSDPRAKQVLDQIRFLKSAWQSNGSLASTYAHDGAILDADQAPAMYGGTIGYFMAEDPQAAKSIYETKLASLYDPGTSGWKTQLSYYDDNWAWFGIGLYSGLLPNLTTSLPSSAFQK